MNPRLDISKHINSGLGRAMLNLSNEVQSKLERPLFELVKIRASQINGCAYCIDMHTKDARLGGETEQRIYALNAWRETPFFTDRERAALEWTEAVTRVGRHACTGRDPRTRGSAVRGSRARGADLCGDRHQQLESPGRLVPCSGRHLSAQGGGGVEE